ncbi:PH domain-containing protein [Nocardia aurantia]|nr:PH domain-containing protein [Nocardia aurantia]
MLLLHPVREVVRYIPVLLATVIIGTRNDNPMWGFGALVFIVAVAVTRWFTTTYRLGPDTVELRRGLIQRKTLTVPRSRIRSVDVRADLLHRLLGLAVLTIGTGQLAGREERFHLDGVDARAVPALRAALLSDAVPNRSPRTDPAAPPPNPPGQGNPVSPPPVAGPGIALTGPAPSDTLRPTPAGANSLGPLAFAPGTSNPPSPRTSAAPQTASQPAATGLAATHAPAPNPTAPPPDTRQVTASHTDVAQPTPPLADAGQRANTAQSPDTRKVTASHTDVAQPTPPLADAGQLADAVPPPDTRQITASHTDVAQPTPPLADAGQRANADGVEPTTSHVVSGPLGSSPGGGEHAANLSAIGAEPVDRGAAIRVPADGVDRDDAASANSVAAQNHDPNVGASALVAPISELETGRPGRAGFGRSDGASRGYFGESEPAGAEIGHWRAGWVRYAPLSLTGLAIFGPLAGLASQYGATDRLVHSQTVQGLGRHSGLFLALVALTGVMILLLVSAAAASLRYLTTWFGLRVIDDGQRLHINHGLFTTRQITLDLSRLRGATVNEPLLLRLAGAAELEAVMTGTRTRQRILPQAPRAAVDRTLAHLLSETIRQGAPESNTTAPQYVPIEAWAPVTAELVRHGSRAHRRRYVRALAPVAVAAAITLGISLGGNHIPDWIWLILVFLGVVAAAVAEDRYRGLGHAVLPGAGARPTWLITRDGSLDRERHCLAAPGVIGWTVRRTFFQRRAGLATVVAATAAGKKRYLVRDVPVAQAWDIVDSVTPGILGTR